MLGSGVPRERVHLERFSVAPMRSATPNDTDTAVTAEVVIELDRKHHDRAVPGGQHVAADRADGGPAGAVVVRDRFVRNVYGPHRLG